MATEESGLAEKPRRAERIEAIRRAQQRASIESVMFNQLVADGLGVNLTDLKCTSILQLEGPLTAGRLAELAGLTTGAITGVVDRLEKARLVERAADPDDRRRVILRLLDDRNAEEAPLYGALAQELGRIYDEYSDEQLDTILDFTNRSVEATERVRLKQSGSASPAAGEIFTAPLGRLTSARLEFPRGAWTLRVSGDPMLESLYEARFDNELASVRHDRGVVSVQYRWPTLVEAARQVFGGPKTKGTLVLNGSIPWEIELKRGMASMEWDLSLVPVRSLRMLSGVSDVEVTLPVARGTVPIRIHGGVSNLKIHRPEAVPARLTVAGGISNVRFDRKLYRASEKFEGSQSPEYAGAADRYDIEVAGGISNLTVDTR